jgi:hypothetical protein
MAHMADFFTLAEGLFIFGIALVIAVVVWDVEDERFDVYSG